MQNYIKHILFSVILSIGLPMLGALEAPIVYANHETPPSVCGDGILDP